MFSLEFDNKVVLFIVLAILLRQVVYPDMGHTIYETGHLAFKINVIVSRCAGHKLSCLDSPKSLVRMVFLDLLRNLPNLVLTMLVLGGKVNFTVLEWAFTVSIATTLVMYALPRGFWRSTRYFWIYTQCEFRIFFFWNFMNNINKASDIFGNNFFSILLMWYCATFANANADLTDNLLQGKLSVTGLPQAIFTMNKAFVYHYAIMFAC